LQLDREEGDKLINSAIDYIFELLRNEFLKKINVSKNIITIITTIVNMDIYTVIGLILQKYGYGYLLKWVFWLSLI